MQRKNPYVVGIFPLRIGFSPRKPVFEPIVVEIFLLSIKSVITIWKISKGSSKSSSNELSKASFFDEKKPRLERRDFFERSEKKFALRVLDARRVQLLRTQECFCRTF